MERISIQSLFLFLMLLFVFPNYAFSDDDLFYPETIDDFEKAFVNSFNEVSVPVKKIIRSRSIYGEENTKGICNSVFSKNPFGLAANFDFDSYAIKPSSFSVLNAMTAYLKSEKGRIMEFKIIGHTDQVGPASYNQKLSEQRAIAVRKYLINAGIDGSRIETEGLGERELKKTDEASRRVEVHRTK